MQSIDWTNFPRHFLKSKRRTLSLFALFYPLLLPSKACMTQWEWIFFSEPYHLILSKSTWVWRHIGSKGCLTVALGWASIISSWVLLWPVIIPPPPLEKPEIFTEVTTKGFLLVITSSLFKSKQKSEFQSFNSLGHMSATFAIALSSAAH